MNEALLPTTVVGSYPAVSPQGVLARLNPHRAALKVAVEDQIAAGIDIISDGQVRGDMITSIAELLPGIRNQTVVGQVTPPGRHLTVQDTRYALSRHPKVKGILTGPSTLAHALKIETPIYRDRRELIPDIARALAREAKDLEGAGVAILQVDEPILSTGVADIDTGRKAIDVITKELTVPTCLHVCGALEKVIDDLLKFDVDILDFEFACNPANLDILSAREIGKKSIGFGVVDTTSKEVESIEAIRKRVEQAIEVFGPSRLLIDPDCGLRMHTRKTAFAKLSHMVEACRRVRGDLSG